LAGQAAASGHLHEKGSVTLYNAYRWFWLYRIIKPLHMHAPGAGLVLHAATRKMFAIRLEHYVAIMPVALLLDVAGT
jgi:hypothetical protein